MLESLRTEIFLLTVSNLRDTGPDVNGFIWYLLLIINKIEQYRWRIFVEIMILVNLVDLLYDSLSKQMKRMMFESLLFSLNQWVLAQPQTMKKIVEEFSISSDCLSTNYRQRLV